MTGSRSSPNTATWPSGCHDPDSCHRHSACMYVQCRRHGKDGNEVAAEIARVPTAEAPGDVAGMIRILRASSSQFKRDVADALERSSAATVDAVAAERQRCAIVALEQRCERGTPWDLACTTIANAIVPGIVNHAPRRDVGTPLEGAPAPYIDPDLDKVGNRRYWAERAQRNHCEQCGGPCLRRPRHGETGA